MKTAVSTVFVGKKRDYNRRFLEMCSHHLVEPVACTPGAGWEKGQVEKQVGDLRGRLFVPIPRGQSYAEINEWLMDRCIIVRSARVDARRRQEAAASDDPLHDPTGGWGGHVWDNYGRTIVDCAVEAMRSDAEVDCPLVVRRP